MRRQGAITGWTQYISRFCSIADVYMWWRRMKYQQHLTSWLRSTSFLFGGKNNPHLAHTLSLLIFFLPSLAHISIDFQRRSTYLYIAPWFDEHWSPGFTPNWGNGACNKDEIGPTSVSLIILLQNAKRLQNEWTCLL